MCLMAGKTAVTLPFIIGSVTVSQAEGWSNIQGGSGRSRCRRDNSRKIEETDENRQMCIHVWRYGLETKKSHAKKKERQPHTTVVQGNFI